MTKSVSHSDCLVMLGTRGPAILAETIRFKRALTINGQLPAHRCQYCEAVLSACNPPLGQIVINEAYLTEELFNVVSPRARIGELTRLGCKWWSLVDSLASRLPGLPGEYLDSITAGDLEAVIGQYDHPDTEIPPTSPEQLKCGLNLSEDAFDDDDEQQKGNCDQNLVRVRLIRNVPYDLTWRMVSHTVEVSAPEGVASEAQSLMVIGRPGKKNATNGCVSVCVISLIEADSNTRGSEHLVSPISVQPGSASSFALMRHWLQNCANGHNCGIRDSPPAMPRIVLDVQGSLEGNAWV